MICKPCKESRHDECPNNRENWRTDPEQKFASGLSPEGDAIQCSGLCPCQHKVPE